MLQLTSTAVLSPNRRRLFPQLPERRFALATYSRRRAHKENTGLVIVDFEVLFHLNLFILIAFFASLPCFTFFLTLLLAASL